MTTHTDPWPAGAPCWADITVADLDGTRAFYGAVLGWEFRVGGPETGGYTQAFVGDRRVAGLAAPMGDAPAPPPAWCVYLATDDAAGVASRAEQLGATVIVPPMPILGFGSMVLLADPTGAVFGLWQPESHTGWQAIDEPGAPTWWEVMSHDQPAALAFYTALFPYQVQDQSAPGFTYATLQLGGHPAAGVGAYGSVGPDVPAAWTLYFAVDDADAAATRAAEHGGSVVSPPTDTPYGRMAIVTGPSGEVFAVMALTAQAEQGPSL
jgi:uncharacterized protein